MQWKIETILFAKALLGTETTTTFLHSRIIEERELLHNNCTTYIVDFDRNQK